MPKSKLTLIIQLLLIIPLSLTTYLCFIDSFLGGMGWLGLTVVYCITIFQSE